MPPKGASGPSSHVPSEAKRVDQRVLDQSEWKTKMDKGKVINMDNPMTQDLTLTSILEDNVNTCRDGSEKLVGNMSAFSEEGMPELPQQTGR